MADQPGHAVLHLAVEALRIGSLSRLDEVVGDDTSDRRLIWLLRGWLDDSPSPQRAVTVAVYEEVANVPPSLR
jgi:hypothetical protein